MPHPLLSPPVPSCPTCRVPEVDRHGFAVDLEGGRVLLEDGGDIDLAGDKGTCDRSPPACRQQWGDGGWGGRGEGQWGGAWGLEREMWGAGDGGGMGTVLVPLSPGWHRA